MSELAGGPLFFGKQAQEEGHGSMQNQPLDRVDNHVFVSSKGDSIVGTKSNQSPFIMDDELVTWLQYPLDEDTCPDIFQHWPPAQLAPAPTSAFASLPIANLKNLSQQEGDTFMVNVALEKHLQVDDGRKTHTVVETAGTPSKQASPRDGVSMELKEREEGGAQQDSLRFTHENESTSTDPRRQAGLHMDEQHNIPAQRELFLQEEPKIWMAREAFLATSSSPQFKHTLAEKKSSMAEPPRMANTDHSNLLHQLHAERCSSHYRAHKEPAQANPTADAALALGAGRAAGAIRTSGMEAFTKVRTSSRSLRPFKLGSPPSALSPTSPSGKGVFHGPSSPIMLPPRARPVDFHSVTPSNQQSFTLKPQVATQPYLIRPSVNVPEPLTIPLTGVGNSNDNTLKDSPLESTMTASGGSRGTKQVKEGANVCSGGSRAAALQNINAPHIQKLSRTSSLVLEKRDDVAFSGDSETSESLKETLSGSKRKLEDSECQSEDVEGESAVNSQTRNASSKRTRANEVHNLSERRRRNRINDKMNALRELIPNASKTNKAALLDEAIDYLKNLQLQLQVMSVRTGMSLSPMVVPPGLPHMQAPQMSPLYPVGVGGSSTGLVSAGGSTMGVAMCNMTYGVPARPHTSLTNSDPRMLQPQDKNSFNQLQSVTAPESLPLHYPHSFVQTPSQSIFSVSMDMCNTYLQQQHLQQHQLQQHLHHHEPQASPQKQQMPSPPSPSSLQQPHYQL